MQIRTTHPREEDDKNQEGNNELNISMEESDDFVKLHINPSPSSSSSSSTVPVNSRDTIDARFGSIIQHLQTEHNAVAEVFVIFRFTGDNAKLSGLSPENSLGGGLLVRDRMLQEGKGKRGRDERSPGQTEGGKEEKGKEKGKEKEKEKEKRKGKKEERKGKEKEKEGEKEEQTSYFIAYPVIPFGNNIVRDLQPIDECQSSCKEKDDDDIEFVSCPPTDISSMMTGSLTLLISYISFIMPLALVPLEIFMDRTRECEEYDDSVKRDVLIYSDGNIPIFLYQEVEQEK